MKSRRIYSIYFCVAMVGLPLAVCAQDENEDIDHVVAAQPVSKVPTVTYKGRITDVATGLPVQGAIIQQAGDKRFSAMTDESGVFEIQVTTYANQLLVKAPTYSSVRVHLAKEGEELAIQLYSENFRADNIESVRIGNSATTTDLALSTALTVEDEIAVKLGADVRTLKHSANPAQGAAMFIGGFNSLNINAQPLFIVDGVIFDIQSNRGVMHDGYFNNVLSAIGVNDIEKITVLKNATALYGAKGANGVVLIETKRSKSMATRIDVDVWAGIELTPKLPSMMNADQYRLYVTDVNGNVTSTPVYLDDHTTDKQKYATYHNNTDWTDHVYREAFTQNYNVNVQGGDDIASYNLAVGYVNAQSTLKENDFSRLNMRFNTDVFIAKPLVCRLDVAYSNTVRDLRDDGMKSSNIFAPGALALIKSPILNRNVADGDGRITSSLADFDVFGLSNPAAILQKGSASNKNRLEYSLFSLNVTPELTINKQLSFSQKLSYVLNNVSERYFLPDEGVPTVPSNGTVDTKNRSRAFSSKQTSVLSDSRIQWQNQYEGHTISAFGGFRYMSDSYHSDGITADNSAGDKLPNIGDNMVNRKVVGVAENWKSTAVYFNADWNYAEKYFLQGTLSGETSTRFGENASGGIKMGDYVWGVFSSLQAAWVVSGESFFKGVKGIDYLKLNVGIDQSGNDNIDCFASRSYFSPAGFLNQTSGLVLANIGNDKLKWETVTRLVAGADMGLFNDRVKLGFNYFTSKTDNLLTYKKLPGISGLKYYLCNEGEMENRGFDLSLNAKVLALKDFTWEIGGSIAHYKNKITALPDNDREIISSIYGAEVLTKIGSPAGLFYGYKTQGVFATSEDAAAAELYNGSKRGRVFGAGDIHFVDLVKDGIIDDNDKTVIGDPNPDVYGNLFTSVHYKNWALDALFSYSIGNDIYNYQRSVLEGGKSRYNQTTAMVNRWTNEKQITDMPRATLGDPMGNSRFSDRWIEDGSYLKLKTLRLSYIVPITSTYLQGVTVWGAANNLFTCTKYLGGDPELSMSNSPINQGIDRGLLGSGRNFVLGVKINL